MLTSKFFQKGRVNLQKYRQHAILYFENVYIKMEKVCKTSLKKGCALIRVCAFFLLHTVLIFCVLFKIPNPTQRMNWGRLYVYTQNYYFIRWVVFTFQPERVDPVVQRACVLALPPLRPGRSLLTMSDAVKPRDQQTLYHQL